ncbi:uncharacterized protein CLUP02_07852 [Colletotrichum lupini]|uniref:Uncharacterized protein n=1 Tax=Colletotrichum lupini TaxID=145971 RepID=A0A9Q8SRS2_9PEZI|nr:uncharacterized protein CLUP02_07852 [Colletotrichum lupini]UQC82364.1 hypothetical protein CLUP02_07852 [Colletotrichum lupini]
MKMGSYRSIPVSSCPILSRFVLRAVALSFPPEPSPPGTPHPNFPLSLWCLPPCTVYIEQSQLRWTAACFPLWCASTPYLLQGRMSFVLSGTDYRVPMVIMAQHIHLHYPVAVPFCPHQSVGSTLSLHALFLSFGGNALLTISDPFFPLHSPASFPLFSSPLAEPDEAPCAKPFGLRHQFERISTAFLHLTDINIYPRQRSECMATWPRIYIASVALEVVARSTATAKIETTFGPSCPI